MRLDRLIGCALALGLAASVAQAQVACPAAPPPLPPPLAAVVDCGNPEFQSCAIDVGGIPRHFCIHVPAAPPADVPVVLGLHGGGGMGSRAVNWLDKHTEQGMILVAPTALPSGPDCKRQWRHLGAAGPASNIATWADFGAADACGTAVGPWPASSANGADLDFISTLMDAVDSTFSVSDRYVLGFSNGAGMALQLLITEPLASRFEGYAFIANGITEPKRVAQTGGGFGPYTANTDTPRPAMLVWGTADKTAVPAAQIIEQVNAASALVPPPPDCVPPLDTPEKVVQCWMGTPAAPGRPKFTFRSRIEETAGWLVGFNGAAPRAIEGAYPDLGHGDAPLDRQDATVVVRQDYPARPRQGGEPVAVLTVVGGAHVVPGASGNHAPCAGRNCDVDAIEEVLQFWRAHAGLRNLWR